MHCTSKQHHKVISGGAKVDGSGREGNWTERRGRRDQHAATSDRRVRDGTGRDGTGRDGTGRTFVNFLAQIALPAAAAEHVLASDFDHVRRGRGRVRIRDGNGNGTRADLALHARARASARANENDIAASSALLCTRHKCAAC